MIVLALAAALLGQNAQREVMKPAEAPWEVVSVPKGAILVNHITGETWFMDPDVRSGNQRVWEEMTRE